MITSKRKRYGGHWIMRGDKVIGEAWPYRHGAGFGMSIGGPLVDHPAVYWRNGEPAASGFTTVAADRLQDLVALAQKHFAGDPE